MLVHETSYARTRVGKPEIARDDKEEKEEMVSGLATDDLALLGTVDPDTLEGDSPQAQAYTCMLLAMVPVQDVAPAEGSDGTDGRWRIPRRWPLDRIVSIVDAEARHAYTLRCVTMDGFKGHISAEAETWLYTNAAMPRVSGPGSSDADAGIELLSTDTTMTDDDTDYQVPGGRPAVPVPCPRP
ncbi:hypothetical protein CVV68_22415 [Arthrobacter livingstonensis]|uniref:Uncharacterized protein n=1 Tax=Arthrobacter livingstonensis TaxID=670078 RepID=A0A2V5KZF2_9MICC|nr:hypothetical protein [Arthrobacter livingstonensis]PYI64271.1 hypothetical protein CVV68_22415 [Arthrobacter livingstonensis]